MTTITVNGMSCQHCVASVQQALEEIPGISHVTVDLDKKLVSYDGDVGIEVVAKALSNIGFEAVVE